MVSGIVFAACVLTLIGCFHAIAGLVAIIDHEFYVVARNYTFNLDTSAWGWLHLLLGIALVITGWGLFSRSTWAGVVAIVLAMLSALANFFFIPYYPLVVDPHGRPRRLGHLGTDAPWSDRGVPIATMN